MKAGIKLVILLLVTALISACSAIFADTSHQSAHSSSLVDFLYPKEQDRVAHSPEIPTLNLPLRVGIAFVPSRNHWYEAIPQRRQLELLNMVRQEFIQQDYIDHIELIPSTYLEGREGWNTVDQLARLYGFDVIALVSYDQVRTTSDRSSSILYWTIYGLYTVKGTENETQTFVDTAVFDVKTRSMLFRAPGTSSSSTRSTAMAASTSMRQQAHEDFELAVVEMNEF
ncbi:rhombotarget lipoprotein [Aliidiomarina sanyensis]|uniref:Rhombotarget lipoprotein n=1 Tax=Aliidiomarina sanyensis TaxID=1249555 RepID=A0A432WG68_9GAMM|nr:rhombotarget lipoprotein [Aliidiomarina sanyensis]RUO32802.1 rhombotarget lipoprotein [Aliidiomarina sanyensis]